MLQIYGLPDGLLEPAEWACDQLGITGVTLLFDFCTPDDGFHGEVMYDEEEDHYIIEIADELDDDDLLIALFHELYHVHQMVYGDLVEHENRLLWQGESVVYEGNYHDTPWEKEAMTMEKVLYNLFMTEYSKSSDMEG